jgi:uncharacterized protein
VKPSRNPSELKVALATGATITALVYPAAAPGTGAALVLGHGAGGDQRSRFMVEMSRALSTLGLDVVTFNFPYTEQGRRIPDRPPLLEACYRSTIETIRRDLASAQRHLFIGGKSMGGRIATQVAAADSELPIEGLVLLGYPLHPPGRPDQRRDKHLPAIRHPMLIVQGGRDAFGTPAELEPVLAALPRPATLQVVPGGDHSFKTSRIDPAQQIAMIEEVQRAIVAWIAAIVSR